jgi:unsaturated rhamnogalacturonyl hydrolase
MNMSETMVHLLPNKTAFADAAIPAGFRVPFGWQAGVIGKSDGYGAGRLEWSGQLPSGFSGEQLYRLWLRFTVAIDVREEKLVEIRLAQSGEKIGSCWLRFAYALQPFEVELDPLLCPRIQEEGIELLLIQGEVPLWIISAMDDEAENRLLQPHLLALTEEVSQEDREARFFAVLRSTASIQPFGWMEGCVLDGLLDLAQSQSSEVQTIAQGQALTAEKAVGQVQTPAEAHAWLDCTVRHLRKFLDKHDQLVYENPRSVIADGTIYGIEGTLMFAAISKLWPPGHKLTMQVIDFWASKRTFPDSMISAEGSYTIAYPMAVIAVRENRADYAEEAVQLLLLRRDGLAVGDDLYLRYYNDGSRTFRNWSRGYAWYMQGLVRTLIELESAPSADGEWSKVLQSKQVAELKQEWQRIVQCALQVQEDNGLWSCFLGEAETGTETSGSAGIAAAIALGARHGLNEATIGLAAASKAYEALMAYLTPDGLLGGVTQSNRGGEPFQRSGYRVISQMGVGLLGQLAAALSSTNKEIS